MYCRGGWQHSSRQQPGSRAGPQQQLQLQQQEQERSGWLEMGHRGRLFLLLLAAEEERAQWVPLQLLLVRLEGQCLEGEEEE